MRDVRRILLAPALLFAPLLFGQGPQTAFPPAGPSEGPVWSVTLPEAVERARALPDGRLLVEIREAQCPECERMEKLLYPSASFKAFLADKVPVRLLRGSPDGGRLAERFRVRATPAWLVMTTDLLLSGKVEGDTNQSSWIDAFLASEKAWAGFRKKLDEERANPADPALALAVGEEAFGRFGDAMAEERFARVAADAKAPAALRERALAFLATVALDSRRLDDAEKALKQILATSKDAALVERAELRLADVDIGRGDRPKATARVKAFLERHPQSPLRPQAEDLLRILAERP